MAFINGVPACDSAAVIDLSPLIYFFTHRVLHEFHSPFFVRLFKPQITQMHTESQIKILENSHKTDFICENLCSSVVSFQLFVEEKVQLKMAIAIILQVKPYEGNRYKGYRNRNMLAI